MPGHGRGVNNGAITVAGTSVNLYTLAGSPGAAGSYAFIIASGTVGSDGSNPALRTGAFPAGSTILLTINGNVYGFGGLGGGGGGSGNAGGDAIILDCDGLTIDNSGGNVFGGGGGGGSGASGSWFSGTNGGGGGGGGQGSPGGLGGSGGGSTGSGAPGDNGSNGSVGAPGTSGAGGAGSDLNGTAFASGGGDGGPWGTAGYAGSPSGFAGGAAGYAVRKNGHSLTWAGGNNVMQVRGNVA